MKIVRTTVDIQYAMSMVYTFVNLNRLKYLWDLSYRNRTDRRLLHIHIDGTTYKQIKANVLQMKDWAKSKTDLILSCRTAYLSADTTEKLLGGHGGIGHER